MKLVGDLETSGFLDSEAIDYTCSPYRLKDSYKIHCASFINIETNEEYDFDPTTIHLVPEFLSKATQLIFANGINFDLLALKLYFGLDYTIGEDTLGGRPIQLDDTMVMSKTLNPDRYQGHRVEGWGRHFKFPKTKWKQEAIDLGLITKDDPKGAEFKVYHPRMLEYCKQDTRITLKTYLALIEEWGDWDWAEAYKLEKKVQEIVTRQEHRGFWFFKDKAEKVIKDLDTKMRKIEGKVEPMIPPKRPTQAFLKEHSFPAKCFRKDGSESKSFLSWVEKNNIKVFKDSEGIITKVHWLGKDWPRDFPETPVVTEAPGTMKDSTHIKEWLIERGWRPSSFKERDLTVDQKKKKISKEKFIKVVDKYIKTTLESSFAYYRCKHLGVEPNVMALRAKLLSHDSAKPLRVLTNPTFTIGQEKELCPGLNQMKDKFPYAEEVVHWLTYNHRRNSVLGGGISWGDDSEAEKGYLSQKRINQDNRISTPADTCGAGTGRFLHRVVVNIPRVTSLYGRPIRELFGADPKLCYQLGYDFAGLEARIEGAYTYKYLGGVDYSKALIADKPLDLHTSNAKKLGISRDQAKTVKYALTYGSQPASLAKSMGWTLRRAREVYNEFWESAGALKRLKDRLESYWAGTGKKYILGLDGRKIPVRSKHSLLNTLFQSAGVICAKRAMLLHEEKLKNKDLILDFFKEDWKSKEFSQQMIAMHDECQIEVSKTLVKIKSFRSKEEAEEWRDNYTESSKLILSNIGHLEDKYYVAYSGVGEMAIHSVREAGEFYKLDIPLDADYCIGATWGGTH